MKGLAITNSEDISLLEIKELLGVKCKNEKNVVIFDCDAKKLCDLCYFGRSVSRVMELICSFDFKDLEDIKKKIKIEDFSAETFAVKCIREGKHDFSSANVEKIVGDKVSCKVDLKNPQKILLAYVCDNKFYLGIDYSGFDLGKRDYKIFVHPASIRGDVAYSLLRIADFGKKDALLDPFCGSGTILIEAALFCMNKSVHFYSKDKFGFLKFMKYDFKDEAKGKCKIIGMDLSKNAILNAQKNAKIAGVEIDFQVADVEWLDTKLDECYFDRIVTNPTQLSKRKDQEPVKKAFEDLFHNAQYVLKPKGTVTIITRTAEFVKAVAKKNGFDLIKENFLIDSAALVFEEATK